MNLQKSNPSRVGPTTLTTSSVLQFTADKRYAVERWSFTNYSAADTTITLYLVTSGGSASDSNKIVGDLTILANDVTTIPFPVVLEVGDKIYALAGAATSVNLTFLVNHVEMSMQ